MSELYRPSRAERFAQVLTETLGIQPRSVYYPGIGAAEESLDYSSAFTLFDAEQVIGVDLWDYDKDIPPSERDEILLTLNSKISRWLKQDSSTDSVHIQSDSNMWQASFIWRDKPRILRVNKNNIDAAAYVPEFDFNVIYSKRTYRLIKSLPSVVYDRAQLVVDQEQYRAEGESVREWIIGNRTDYEIVTLDPRYGDGATTVARKRR